MTDVFTEYLETDGTGGFFCGSMDGQIRRRWHGWWIAETPPRGRGRIMAGFDLRLVIDAQEYWLTAHHDFGSWKRPDVYPEKDVLAWRHRAFHLNAKFAFNREERSLILMFELGESVASSATLHSRFIYPAGLGSAEVIVSLSGSDNARAGEGQHEFLNNIVLEMEKDCERIWTESVSRKHAFSAEITVGKPFVVTLRPQALEYQEPAEYQPDRPVTLQLAPGWRGRGFEEKFHRAALQFVVRGEGSTTILAGYPWFTDWGRDAMISIPGLCVATGLMEEAREIVMHFLDYQKQGLIPNIFPEHGDEPRYNTVDATLWLVEVVFHLWSVDEICGHDALWEHLKSVIEWHKKGTLNHTRVESDGLLAAGDPGSQLTWMDVKVNDEVPTPRHGKPVEIQGLWYNALMLVSKAAGEKGEDAFAADCVAAAERAAATFALRFIKQNTDHLADVVDRDGEGSADWSIRPNMVLPFALHHNIIPEKSRAAVLHSAERHLVTPRGLRTLSPENPSYKGIYRGDVVERDHAYHMGTVWMWLMGPYVKGVIAERGNVPDLFARLPGLVDGLADHFENEACVNQCSEIFDGDYPHKPRGCFAQAWSTAALIEILQIDLNA